MQIIIQDGYLHNIDWIHQDYHYDYNYYYDCVSYISSSYNSYIDSCHYHLILVIGHVVVDGIVDVEPLKDKRDQFEAGRLMNPDDIADAYWFLFNQSLSCVTFELDMRPSLSKWT